MDGSDFQTRVERFEDNAEPRRRLGDPTGSEHPRAPRTEEGRRFWSQNPGMICAGVAPGASRV